MLAIIKRGFIVALSFILQIGFFVGVMLFLYDKIVLVQIIVSLLSIIIVLSIIKNTRSLTNDLPWIMLILVTPIAGTLIYLALGRNMLKSKTLKKIYESEKNAKKYYIVDKKISAELDEKNLDKLKYFNNYLGYPVTKNNEITYYELGDYFYPEFLIELKSAKKYIFMEYFIINEKGTMWPTILEILKEKVKEGVEVRVMYDDMGSISTLPSNYKKYLNSFGIKCVVFNEVKIFRGIFMNNRDHRKITVIDGKVGFSGGVNLADEYININSPHGFWKDNGIKIVGNAVWNLTVLFLTNWNAYTNEDKDFKKFQYQFDNMKENGYVVPYGASPINPFVLEGEDVYLNIINQAKRYVYIMTPYLIIDQEMINALILARRRGVDVKILVPGIPDKKIVYSLTKSYIKNLVDANITVLTYTKGFVHSKVFVSDDSVATVGTINMDYRSLYLHFENGIYMENVDEIKKIKKDVVNTINESHIVSKEEVKYGFFKRIWHSILRIFAPLF